MITDEHRSVYILQLKNLHTARLAEADARAALVKFDAEDEETISLNKLITDAQARLQERQAREDRKSLETVLQVTSDSRAILDQSIIESVTHIKTHHPDIETLPGVVAFNVEETVVIVEPERALKLIAEQMWGVPDLLKINTEVLLKLHRAGVLKPEWERETIDMLEYVFGNAAVLTANMDSWYSVNQTVKPVIETDFTNTLRKLEGRDINPAALIEVKLPEDKSA
jgi:hypothetical protein